MPRVPTVPKPPVAPPSIAVTRAANGRGAATKAFIPVEISRAPDVKETCPLCIEDLDATDLSFSPCPCGYRVCLFCFEQLKLHCRSQCPGCRREYGKAEDISETRQSSDDSPERGSSSAATQAARPAAGQSSARPSTSKPAVSHATKKGPEQATPVKRTMEEASAGLPSGATWATNISRHQSVESIERPAPPLPPAAVDDSAWPTLGSASTSTAPAPQNGTHRQRQNSHLHQNNNHNDEHSTLTSHSLQNHRRSMSISTGSIDGAPSCSSLDTMSQDPSQELPQQRASSNVPAHLADAFASAQVFSTVQGVRRAVNVPLGLSSAPPVEPYKEAPALLANMQHAVKAGSVSSKEAAAHLVALLRQKEKEATPVANGAGAGPRQSLLAAGKAPPGFAPTTMASPTPVAPAAPASSYNPTNKTGGATQAPLSLNPLNNQDNPIVPGPPVGRYNPISPPLSTYSNGGGLYGAGAVGSGAAGTSGGGAVQAARLQYQPQLMGSSPAPVSAQQQQQQQGYHPQLGGSGGYQPHMGNGGSGANGGTYSLWSGLPGIDLAASSPLLSLWQQASSQSAMYSQQYNGTGLGAFQDPAIAYAQPASKPPPPGFGGHTTAPPPGFGGTAESTYRPLAYQSTGSSDGGAAAGAGAPGYNPLGQLAAGGRAAGGAPPGMNAYRPQLGL